MEDPLFSEDEKRFVLCEIIKTSRIEVDELIFFIQAHNVLPNWMRVLMPPGRNLAQCLAVANMMSILPRARPASTPSDQSHSSSRSPPTPAPHHVTRPDDAHDDEAKSTLAATDSNHASPRKKRRTSVTAMYPRKLRVLAPRPPRDPDCPPPPLPPHRMPGYRHILPATPHVCLTTPPAEKLDHDVGADK